MIQDVSSERETLPVDPTDDCRKYCSWILNGIRLNSPLNVFNQSCSLIHSSAVHLYSQRTPVLFTRTSGWKLVAKLTPLAWLHLCFHWSEPLHWTSLTGNVEMCCASKCELVPPRYVWYFCMSTDQVKRQSCLRRDPSVRPLFHYSKQKWNGGEQSGDLKRRYKPIHERERGVGELGEKLQVLDHNQLWGTDKMRYMRLWLQGQLL